MAKMLYCLIYRPIHSLRSVLNSFGFSATPGILVVALSSSMCLQSQVFSWYREARCDDSQAVLETQEEGRLLYVDVEIGDDSRFAIQAQVRNTPWRSLTRASEFMKAGDTIVVAPGVYREILIIKRGGLPERPIRFVAEFSSRPPIISGADPIPRKAWTWTKVEDFCGKQHDVLASDINFEPGLLYDDVGRMLIAQHPNQTDFDDPFDVSVFLPVPLKKPSNLLIDPDLLNSGPRDFWKGASLLLYDAEPNLVSEVTIVSSDPVSATVEVDKKFQAIGNASKGKTDRYSLSNHLSLLDQPGEYYVDRNGGTTKIYAIPRSATFNLSIGRRDYGIQLGNGVKHVEIDGFVIENCKRSAIDGTSKSVSQITIKNSVARRCEGDGIRFRFVEDIEIDSCRLTLNRGNGINLMNAKSVRILGSEIDHNGDNGVWIGGGQVEPWNSEKILISDCFIHDHSSRRRHPDNFQMHQVRDITIEKCRFVQSGHQNMWCQYSDEFVLRGNVFVGGRLGINSSINSQIVHNVFWNSGLRFDRHLTNHPQLKDYFLPKQSVIRNNAIVSSSMAWPSESELDKFEVFRVDHNLYCPRESLKSWDWEGAELALSGGAILVTQQEFGINNVSFDIELTNSWSADSKIVFLYKDQRNYYWIGVGKNQGVFRCEDGIDRKLRQVGVPTRLSLEHARSAEARYTVRMADGPGDRIRIEIDCSGKGRSLKAVVEDAKPSFIKSGSKYRIGLASPDSKNSPCAIRSIRVSDGASEKTLRLGGRRESEAKGEELLWRLDAGKATIRGRGGEGIGIGDGSIVVDSVDELSKVFRRTPSQQSDSFDFRPAENSPLIGAGAALSDDGGIGSAATVSIGPFEPVD